jgi:hypothetical protein
LSDAASQATGEGDPEGGGSPPPTADVRLRTALRLLDPEQRLAALAAFLLGASIFLPWWRDPILHVSYIGFRRLTFLEVALLLVAVGVLVLLLRRAEGHAFHLPLSDGTLIAASGFWSCLLVLVRMVDPPTRTVGGVSSDYDMRWGIVIALAAAALLTVAGVRTRRRRHAGEPEAVAADADATPTLPLSH